MGEFSRRAAPICGSSDQRGVPMNAARSFSVHFSGASPEQFAFLAGTVGSVLTLMCLGAALDGGDYRAAYSMWPLTLTLIAVVNGWIAVNVFIGSGLRK